ncbi:RNA polymerase sigma-70 factor, ECF subfamily [Parapedobacter composti]|uniref:RNA polymerase sigma-70 factor, ECF subfamily n=1 Tax=Parapedobacter composti TaxID=623281 RepID=A0A1I1M8N1_9SPHI|nr:sigma-70 family RNA polymerase sigma factor [Parapedobacter composti]SFC81585.1 RNA polymerase sigma-70 factor, ECF subfamily [Parapedobacter composti]
MHQVPQKAKTEINGFIRKWLEGNELAFNAILDYYYRPLLASSRQMVSNAEDAEELVMNAFLKIWQHKHRLADVRKFDDYLFGILRQEIVARSRKHVMATENIDELPLNAIGMVDHPELTLKELQARYQAALEKLTPRQREVFLYSREQDMSQQEIARRTGMSVHTVNNHMTSALKAFRREMNEYPDTLIVILLTSPYTLTFFC